MTQNIKITGGNKELKARVNDVLQFAIDELDIRNGCFNLHVKLSKNFYKNNKMFGVLDAELDGVNFVMTVDIDQNKSHFEKELLCTIIHEMVHLKQFVKEELFLDYNEEEDEIVQCWKEYGIGHFDETDYADLPWEKEAYAKEASLYELYVGQL